MNEVTLSTQVKNGKARLSIKLNVEELGLAWQASDIIRVMSYKEDGTLVLKKVGKKSAKTVAHTLTKTGGGDFSHDLGVFVSYRPTRFRNEFKSAQSVAAGARFIDSAKTLLQVYMPRDIFQGEKCFSA